LIITLVRNYFCSAESSFSWT